MDTNTSLVDSRMTISALSMRGGWTTPKCLDYLFNSSTPIERVFAAKKSQFVQISQLVADQAASRTWSTYEEMSQGRDYQHKSWDLSDAFQGISTSLAHLEDLIRTKSPRSADYQPDLNILRIETLYSSVQRNAAQMDILHSALPFWEEFGLGPVSGPKNINAICVYPDQESLCDPVTTFLHEMGSAYQACNLGEHSLEESLPNYPKGHLRVACKSSGFVYDWRESARALQMLGKYLVSLRRQNVNTVVYFLEPNNNEEAVPYLCQSFLYFFEAYRRNMVYGEGNELVLQIVPLRLLCDADTFSIPAEARYKRLAFEVYDRCAPAQKKGSDRNPPYVSASAINLCRPLPRSLDLRLGSAVQGIVPAGGNCLHLAYCWQGGGEQWLTASWTDNFGTRQWNAAYWIGPDDPENLFSAVVAEMWETSLELMRSLRSSLRLQVARIGGLEQIERKVWSEKGNSPDVRVQISLCVLELDSSLQLRPPKSSQEGGRFLLSGTHEKSTALSPEASSQGTVPGQPVLDSTNAKVIDATEEAWSVILNNSSADLVLSDDRRHMNGLTGLLIKRAGPNDEDGVVTLQVELVSLVHSGNGGGGGGKPDDDAAISLLEDTLAKFRNLALLARLRNVSDPLKEVVPIHVVAARNAHQILTKTMRLEDS